MFRNTSILATRSVRAACILTAALATAGCSDSVTGPHSRTAASTSAVKFREAGSSLSWNQTARDLIASRGVAAVATQARILAYLSVAQYNAVVAAEDTKEGGNHASPAAAAAGASLVVLKSFFPADAAMLDSKLLMQKSQLGWPGDAHRNFEAGEAIGRAIGAQVVTYSGTDNLNLTPAPVNPGLEGNWKGVNSVRALYGTRTFALESGDQFRPGPPPVFESDEFDAALQDVRERSDGITGVQKTFAIMWAPRGPAYMNGVAAEMIVEHRRSEREAARILALANMAGFDVLNACFDAKFAYYYIRPTQADPEIELHVPLPNHPSYPSGHSCITAAYATVFAKAFPSEAPELDVMVEDAGLSRMYGGLHFEFDCKVGQQLGRDVAEHVLLEGPTGHAPIPLD